MPYVYQTYIDIQPDHADNLKIGRSLGAALAYMKAVLPDEPGFVTCRSIVSLIPTNDRTHVVLESVWDNWESLVDHLEKSHFVESKFLPQFELDFVPTEIRAQIFEEFD